MKSNMLFKEESTLEYFTAIKACVAIFRVRVFSMCVKSNQIPAKSVANLATELEVSTVLNCVILEREIAFEGEFAVLTRIRNLDLRVIGFEMRFKRLS